MSNDRKGHGSDAAVEAETKEDPRIVALEGEIKELKAAQSRFDVGSDQWLRIGDQIAATRQEIASLNNKIAAELQAESQRQATAFQAQAAMRGIAGSTTLSPASQPHPSRQAIGKVIESLTKCGMECFVGKDSLDVSVAATQLKDAVVMNELTGICTTLLLKPEDVNASIGLQVDFSLLASQGETAFQQGHLKTTFIDVDEAYAMDASASSVQGPFFKPVQLIGEDSVCVQTAKPDATSKVAPMDLEIKSDKTGGKLAIVDWEVLNQAIERVLVRMRIYGFLRLTLAFAVTGRSAWCVVGSRTFEAPDSQGTEVERCRMHMFRIEHSAVPHLWAAVTHRALQEPGFFLTCDGPMLLHAMRSIGAVSWACRVKWLASSMSRVYSISYPGQYTWGSGTVLGIPFNPQRVTCAVKIVRNEKDYEREVKALGAMAKCADDTFYARGGCSSGGTAALFRDNSSWYSHNIDIVEEKQEQECWWHSVPENPGSGGAIFMSHGSRVSKQECRASMRDFVEGACTSLLLAHSAGVLHCDIRLSNILRFGEAWTLIDFGLSTDTKGEVYELPEGSAQAKGAGPRVAKCLQSKAHVVWSAEDDLEMLLQLVLHVLE